MLRPENREAHSRPSSTTALERARALAAPEAELVYGGEYEHGEWWEEHESLLKEAREEWGRKHPELYEPFGNNEKRSDFEDRFLDPSLVRAIRTRNKDAFANLFASADDVPSVYKFRLFTPEFARLLLDEFDHHEQSGIPRRRPNGMNRHGAIMSELGFSDAMKSLVQHYLVHAARCLFPEYVGPDDLAENYAFTVRYRPGEDVKLAEHADASTVTVNVCLQPASGTEGHKFLYFKEQRTLGKRLEAQSSKNATFVDLSEPGQALVHLGQHVHGVSKIDDSDAFTADGARSQLVVWMFGQGGYVRVAPYEPGEIRAYARTYDESFWRKRSQRANAPSTSTGKHEEL